MRVGPRRTVPGSKLQGKPPSQPTCRRARPLRLIILDLASAPEATRQVRAVHRRGDAPTAGTHNAQPRVPVSAGAVAVFHAGPAATARTRRARARPTIDAPPRLAPNKTTRRRAPQQAWSSPDGARTSGAKRGEACTSAKPPPLAGADARSRAKTRPHVERERPHEHSNSRESHNETTPRGEAPGAQFRCDYSDKLLHCG